MALNLVRNGVPLLVFDACRQRAEEAFTPALVAADLRQLAEQCSCIIFCLPNAETCQQVCFSSSKQPFWQMKNGIGGIDAGFVWQRKRWWPGGPPQTG